MNTEQQAPNWIVGGKDGAGTLVYDENCADESQRIVVYGRNQQGIAEDIAALLNTPISIDEEAA